MTLNIRNEEADRLAREHGIDMTLCTWKSPHFRLMWVKGEIADREIRQPFRCPHCRLPIYASAEPVTVS